MIRRYVALFVALIAVYTAAAQSVTVARPMMVAYDDDKAVAQISSGYSVFNHTLQLAAQSLYGLLSLGKLAYGKPVYSSYREAHLLIRVNIHTAVEMLLYAGNIDIVKMNVVIAEYVVS